MITRKFQTAEVLTVRTEPGGRGLYTKEVLIFSRNDQTDEVNKRLVIWPFWTACEFSVTKGERHAHLNKTHRNKPCSENNQ